MNNSYYVYILSNYKKNVLYIGMTNNLIRRAYEHKSCLVQSFSSKYKLNKLVYYEIYDDVIMAIEIEREKQIKYFSRKKKIDLINALNNSWQDLYDKIL